MIIQVLILKKRILGIKGKSNVISTSKIRKITAIRKKRRENGIRADPLGSNPHSNGEFFSRSLIVFLERREEITISAAAIMKIIEMKIDRDKIIVPELVQSC